MLFVGEYKLLGENKVLREYTVHYPERFKEIPHPEVKGWTRLYKETFIPTTDNSMDWITKTFINDQWIPGTSGGDSRAVRDQ